MKTIKRLRFSVLQEDRKSDTNALRYKKLGIIRKYWVVEAK